MRINEIITPEIEQKMLETAMVFARKVSKKNKFNPTIKQMYKCTSGPRFGRKVASIKQCDAPIDIAKRNQMKLTRAKTKVLQARRAKKTKKINPAAIIARRLNKFRKIK
tara:strand:+ start:15292 stop:15618 length:327 start_codon:yes stop_codon:yes gene_type:complete